MFISEETYVFFIFLMIITEVENKTETIPEV